MQAAEAAAERMARAVQVLAALAVQVAAATEINSAMMVCQARQTPVAAVAAVAVTIPAVLVEVALSLFEPRSERRLEYGVEQLRNELCNY